MKITGIICEYNPFHRGHGKQIAQVRSEGAPEDGIVCLMSGNYVQRGHPAILDKSLRAKAALLSGADLVLELPIEGCLSSAEGFARTGVAILGRFCDALCFGAENADRKLLWELAGALGTERFSVLLREALDGGVSFPAARQQAVEAMGFPGGLLEKPNNILAVEYCKAIQEADCAMKPWPISRWGSYHAEQADPENPSATSLRKRMLEGLGIGAYLPQTAESCFAGAVLHGREYGERAMLLRLRTMSEAQLEALPYGAEGLWRKLMHGIRECARLEDILEQVKSKRYTRTRLDRMVMCAYLGITREQLETPAPYVRVLGLNERGGKILRLARQTGTFYNAGQTVDGPYWEQERQRGSLYGLFARENRDPADPETERRVVYLP